jgi:hypothetical protein
MSEYLTVKGVNYNASQTVCNLCRQVRSEIETPCSSALCHHIATLETRVQYLEKRGCCFHGGQPCLVHKVRP